MRRRQQSVWAWRLDGSDGGRAAYVVDGKMAVRREIKTGATSVGEVEIVSGLDQGETIVVSDTSSFQDAKTVMLR